jgi:hypothetical protein
MNGRKRARSVVAAGVTVIVTAGGASSSEKPVVPGYVEETSTSSEGWSQPEAPTSSAESSPAERATSPDSAQEGSGEETPSPDGEVWEWAVGRNGFTDPYLNRYMSMMFEQWDKRNWNTDVYVHAQGFMLNIDGEGIVQEVVLYYDEVELGLPESDTSMHTYQGRLPGGLTWDDTPATLGAHFGDSNQAGGMFGITFSYRTNDGYDFVVTTTAEDESELPTARIAFITVRPSSRWP